MRIFVFYKHVYKAVRFLFDDVYSGVLYPIQAQLNIRECGLAGFLVFLLLVPCTVPSVVGVSPSTHQPVWRHLQRIKLIYIRNTIDSIIHQVCLTRLCMCYIHGLTTVAISQKVTHLQSSDKQIDGLVRQHNTGI